MEALRQAYPTWTVPVHRQEGLGKRRPMTLPGRIALASLVLAVDLVTIAIPMCAIAAAYVIVMRPPRFLHLVLRLYDDSPA